MSPLLCLTNRAVSGPRSHAPKRASDRHLGVGLDCQLLPIHLLQYKEPFLFSNSTPRAGGALLRNNLARFIGKEGKSKVAGETFDCSQCSFLMLLLEVLLTAINIFVSVL